MFHRIFDASLMTPSHEYSDHEKGRRKVLKTKTISFYNLQTYKYTYV